MPEIRTLEEYSKVTSERTRTFRFLTMISLAGLASGVVTVGLANIPGGMPLFVLLGSPFGLAIACSLAISGIARSVLKAIGLVALTTVAFFIARMLTFWTEAHLWGDWSMGSYPTVSPYSLFVGGMTGGFIVLGGTLFLVNPQMRLGTRAWKALLWSTLGGALAPIGWALGPAFREWVMPHDPFRPNAPIAAFQDTPSHQYALFVVWQAGMAFALGMALLRNRATSHREELKLT